MACFEGCFGGGKAKPVKRSLAAIIKKKDIEGAEALIKDLQSNSKVGKTDLPEGIRVVTKAGDANAKLPNGSTCLHEAVKADLVQLAKDLCKAAAELQARDGQGKTVIDIANEHGAKECLSVLNKEISEVSTHDFWEGLSFIAKVPLFKSLHQSDYPPLAAAFKARTFQPGQTVMKQGDIGTEMFIIEQGSVNVLVNIPGKGQEKVATFTVGDYFGEVALLSDKPRTATIVADGVLQVKCLTRKDFDELGLRRKLQFKKRKAVCQKDLEDATNLGSECPKTADELKLIEKGLLDNAQLGPIVKQLDPEIVGNIAKTAYRYEALAGANVITQGDTNADLLFVVQHGNYHVFKDAKKVFEYGPGGSFGELAVMFRHPRAATVTAVGPGILWAVPRQALRTVMQAKMKQKVDLYAKMLEKVKILQEVSREDKRALADAFLETTYKEGEAIITQGEEGDTFYILIDGQATVQKNSKDVGHLTGARLTGKYEHFGERALIKNEPRAASVVCASKECVCLVLDRSVFLQVIEPDQQKSGGDIDMIEYSKDKLSTIGLLGCGGFGIVTLVKCGKTNNCFALKALSKGHVLQHHQEMSIMNEKNIMRMTHSPFLVRLAATFNGKEHVFFLIEPALGGELFTIYQQHNFYGSEEHAKFYVACVVKAFDHLHCRKIVYRDLKPENLLLDAKGYCKVTDFGLAKFVIGHTYTTCGTPDYFAPEMVANSGHTVNVDWWTLGVLLYELVVSETPFYAEDTMKIFRQVTEGIEKVKFPSDAPWTELCKQLCKKEPEQRLPCLRGGVENIYKHRWFKNFDWNGLAERTMKAPYKPDVKSAEDISNFDADDADAPPNVKYNDPGTGWDKPFEDRWGPKDFS